MKQVKFKQMKDGTKEEYLFLRDHEEQWVKHLPDRLLNYLTDNGDTLEGYQISRLQHAMLGATLAYQESGDIDWTVSYLFHDVGDGLSPENHSQLAAAIIRPYVREECTWVVEHHGVFQMYYYAHHYGQNREERQRYKDHLYYQSAVDFCEFWDQRAFDPDLPTMSLEEFTPMVKEVFSRTPFSPSVIKPGQKTALRKNKN